MNVSCYLRTVNQTARVIDGVQLAPRPVKKERDCQPCMAK